jgi:diguanylate cyclase (GGDEF)-like protein
MTALFSPETPALPAPPGRIQRQWRRLGRSVLHLGLWRSTALLTAAVWVLAVALAQLMVSLLGQGDRFVALVSASVLSLLLTPLPGAALLRLVFQLEAARQRIDLLTTHDELTGVPNRRHFMEVAQHEWARARRYGNDAALLLIDADHFKRVNDRHGQRCGDELLRRIALAAAASLRQPDLLARFAGEELIVFLPQTDPLGALDVAERIRRQVQALRLAWQGAEVGTTVSIGVAPLRSELPSLDWMIHEADTALRAAKADGRNCVRTLPFQPKRSGETYPVNSR